MSVHWGGRGAGHVSRWSASTTGVPALVLDFLTTTSLDSRITFSRGSNATLVDSTGKITYAPANLLLRSEEFNNAAWTKTNATITANSTVAPDGTTTADTITDNSTSGQHQVTQTISVVSGVVYTLSVYVKAGTARYVRMSLGGTMAFAAARFDLELGIVQAGPANTTITSVGNNWFRIDTSSTASSSGNGVFAIGITNSTGTAYIGTGSTLFLWGAQLEPLTYQTTAGTYNATTTAAYYGPRFDYDPVTLAAKGLLIEEQRTNLTVQSGPMTTGGWSSDGLATMVPNATTSPDGSVNASQLQWGTNGYRYVFVTTTTATVYTLSIFVKLGTGGDGTIRLQGAFLGATFNLNTLAITSLTATSASITPAGNGWFRCAIVFTSASILTVVDYAMGGTFTSGQGHYFWGAQLEAGAFATSYIPTVASQVTRSADDASMTGTNFSSWYNQTQGTFVISGDRFSAVTYSAFVAASDGTTTNEIYLTQASSQAEAYIRSAAGAAGDLVGAAWPANTVGRAALAYQLNNAGLSYNGNAVVPDTNVGIPTVNRLQIGARGTGAFTLNGHIRFINYYNTRLLNTQLQTLTQ